LRESPGYASGVLFSSGPTWQEQRRFVLQTLRDLGFGKASNEELIMEECNELCDRLEKTKGQPIDLRFEFNISVVNSLWRIITGERLDAKDPRVLKVSQYLDEFNKDFGAPLTALLVFFRPLGRLCDWLGLFRGGKTVRELMVLTNGAVNDSLSQFNKDDLVTFNDHFINQMKLSQSPSFAGFKGMANFKATISDLFIGGSETTSATLIWAMLYMIKYPAIQKKVQVELDETFGKGQVPSAADRHKTPYIEAVLQEVQRKGNIANLSVQHLATEDSTIGGYFIPKGTIVFPHIGELFRNKDFFPNPEQFDPERYLEEGKFKPHPKLVPFGIGRRRCLGETLAKVQLYMFFTGILARFHLEKENEQINISEKRVVSSLGTPLPFKVKFIPRF